MLEPRGAVIADLDGPAALRVVAVHLGLLRTARRRQLAAIREALQRHAPRPTVILGDFNEHSRRVGLGSIARPFCLMPTAATFPSKRSFLHLNWIAHSHDFDVLPIAPPASFQPDVSDHLPLLAELRWA